MNTSQKVVIFLLCITFVATLTSAISLYEDEVNDDEETGDNVANDESAPLDTNNRQYPIMDLMEVKRADLRGNNCYCRTFLTARNSRYKGKLRKYCTCYN